MTETSKTPDVDESPVTIADRLVEIEGEAGWLLAWIHDLELSYHDRVGPELAKLADDLRSARSRHSDSETTEGEGPLIAQGTELDGGELNGEAIVEPAASPAPQHSTDELWLERELRRVKGSFSWRSTAPLRFVRHRIMRLLHRS